MHIVEHPLFNYLEHREVGRDPAIVKIFYRLDACQNFLNRRNLPLFEHCSTAALTEDMLLQTESQRLARLARAELVLTQRQPEIAMTIVDRLIASAPHTPEGSVIPIMWLTRAGSDSASG